MTKAKLSGAAMGTEVKGNRRGHQRAKAWLLAVGLTFSAAADAATITVTNSNDAGPGSLRQAVMDANANADAENRIEFVGELGDIVITTGQIDITKTLTITGPPGRQVISGGAIGSRLLAFDAADSDLTLENLELTNGKTTNDGGAIDRCQPSNGSGAGVCALGNVTIINSRFSANVTEGESAHGGGLFVMGDSLVIEDSSFLVNITRGRFSSGGGLYADTEQTSVIRSRIAGNKAEENFGGAGGMWISGSFSMTDSVVINNATETAGSHGGGIYVFNEGRGAREINLVNSVISSNSAQGNGAGMYLRGDGIEGGTLMVVRSTFSNNIVEGSREEGGGIYVWNADTRLINSTLSGNKTTEVPDPGQGTAWGGAGIYALRGNLEISNSTITGNIANSVGGGGIEMDHNGGGEFTLKLSSSVVAANLGGEGANNFRIRDPFGSSSITLHAEFSMFGDDPSKIDGTDTGNLFTNETGLGALADNGCSTLSGILESASCVRTHLPNATSPLVDAGANPLQLPNDQRGEGFLRISGTAADIGAIERQSTAGAPSLVLDSSVLDFGEVPMGEESGVLTLTIENQGSGPLVLDDPGTAISGPAAGDYWLVENTCVSAPIPPQAVCSMGLRFAPVESGVREARLEIFSNDSAAPTSVTLCGRSDVIFADAFGASIQQCP